MEDLIVSLFNYIYLLLSFYCRFTIMGIHFSLWELLIGSIVITVAIVVVSKIVRS